MIAINFYYIHTLYCYKTVLLVVIKNTICAINGYAMVGAYIHVIYGESFYGIKFVSPGITYNQLFRLALTYYYYYSIMDHCY